MSEGFLPKCVLVTGAAGFIGSNVCKALVTKNIEVLGIDNFDQYYDIRAKQRNLKEIVSDLFFFIEADIRDSLVDLCKFKNVDSIIHLAAKAGVRNSIEHPLDYADTNINGTISMLELARKIDCKNFVFASTSSVYGNSSRQPFVETDTCDRPLAPYPASKRSGELMGHCYNNMFGLNFTALRFFTVYGPSGRPDMMAYKILDNIFKGERVALFNGGKMYRDWTYVDDIVNGIISAVHTLSKYEIINLGGGRLTELSYFVELIEKLAGKKSHLTEENMHIADVSSTLADISKAKRILNYAPSVSLEDGTKRFFDWYMEINK